MGIRFYCPNGHKLNVKSELAGKIGICPKCQARMTIPTASVRSSSHQSEEKSDASEAANVRENEGEKGSDARLNVQNRTDAASLTSGVAPLNQFLDKGDRAEAALGDVLRRAVDGSAPGGRDGERLDDANEPLRDPRLVWYVRSRDNQQYGPATGDVMAAWINERRIGPQTLVWREDWPAWQEAGRVFPELGRVFAGGVASASGGVENAPSTFATLAEAAQNSGAARRFADAESRAMRRRKRATKTFAVIAALIALILGLLGALIFVLLRN
ncbi:MAG: DUF4339 domain-containing protein [Thermoguttaceae bacterium]|nr:DUF4339 domain-containing protein [Thermoguttaceae bacterium]